MQFLLDTNILLRRIQRGDNQHHLTCEAISLLSEMGHHLCVASQSLVEFWAVGTRPIAYNGLGLKLVDVEKILSGMETTFVCLSDSESVHEEWRRLVTAYGVSGKKTYDARLVASMLVHNVSHILTFNIADFSRYSEITVIDPRSVTPVT